MSATNSSVRPVSASANLNYREGLLSANVNGNHDRHSLSAAGLAAPRDTSTNNNSEQYPRPLLPPPLPPINRSNEPSVVPDRSLPPPSMSATQGKAEAPSDAEAAGDVTQHGGPPQPRQPDNPSSWNDSAVGPTQNSSANQTGGPQQDSSHARPPMPPSSRNSTNAVVAGPPPPAHRASNVSTNGSQIRSSSAAGPPRVPPSPTTFRAGTPSRRNSSVARSESEEKVEELMPLSLPRNAALERFFVEYTEAPENDGAERATTTAAQDVGGQPRDENEMLLEQFAEYTDDDSFFSSGSTVIESDPHRMQRSRVRQRAINNVHSTLQLRALSEGRVPEERGFDRVTRTSWLFQVHHRAVALDYSSFFIFPARWTPRVVVYNILHHWLMEVFIFFIILGYSIFQACWARRTAPKNAMEKPDFALWADVFYTMLYGIEIVARLFATGFILHPRAFFRSPWHWLDTAVLVLMILECTWWQYLWNFTAWRLIRAVKCLTYFPAPIRMKLLAKSFLRSTNRVIQVSILLAYFVFFFALLGLQLFVGELRSRCVHNLTGVPTDQVCRAVSTGKFWFYWGYHCPEGYTCVNDAFPNPHYDFRSFDDIGHALLSTFQIMTFQNWTGLMNETSDGLALMAFLYYAFTILLCAWVVPSLFLGVFFEKLEKTSRLFVLKQLEVFENILAEQRQRMSSTVRLTDYVERDEDGRIPHYPAYNKQISDYNTSSSSRSEESQHLRKPVHKVRWNDEQRLQLQLSLTRQRDIAEEAERKRLSAFSTKDFSQHRTTGRASSAGRPSTRPSSAAPAAVASTQAAAENFNLGGRVGALQHHVSSDNIGASRQTNTPFAVRQESAAESLRFLDAYNSIPGSRVNNSQQNLNHSATEHTANTRVDDSVSRSRSRSRLTSGGQRPPLGRRNSVLATREAAGVVPNLRSPSAAGSMARLDSAAGSNNGSFNANKTSVSRLHASVSQPPQAVPVELVINDPEGGDFAYAHTCWDKINIIRNILHMFTEGYPRILSQYLWEHQVMQYRYGLTPLTYTNQYEEEALRKLRQRRAMERRADREDMRRHRNTAHASDSDDDDDIDADVSGRTPAWVEEEGLVPGSMSPIRMARNIQENAPITIFNYIMLFLMIANAVFNASRFDTMPDYWEMGTFVAGVCFSVLFMLELLIRLVALGPGPFFTDFFILVETTFVVISLFQLGFGRNNTTSLFNWIRFLRLFRVLPCRPMRRVTRVLIHAFPDMIYALLIFSLYMFMWLLLGMSFFGSRLGWIDYSTSDYFTRGNFETFSHAAYAISSAFSVTRDQWLYLSWSGMRVRGSYTVMYFIATVAIAFIFRFFFIAVLTQAWQSYTEREGYDEFQSHVPGGGAGRQQSRLHWFDFTVWRSFKHIHGGFERRDVAPDEVYNLNEDMRRQLRMAEAKDRYYNAQQRNAAAYKNDLADAEFSGDDGIAMGPRRYLNFGGQLHRQPSLPPAIDDGEGERGAALDGTADVYAYQGTSPQLRFARQYHAVPATTYDAAHRTPRDKIDSSHLRPSQEQPPADTTSMSHQRSIVNPIISSRHSLAPSAAQRAAYNNTQSHISAAAGDDDKANPSVAAQFLRLGRTADVKPAGALSGRDLDDGTEEEEEEAMFEHLLRPGPRMRYKSTTVHGRRFFEVCMDCNTHKQMPLRAPTGVEQRTADDLHNEHCHMAAVRSSRQFVLNALTGYARLQADHDVIPTKRMLETLLGQAWSCGMLLFETIESLACMDLPESERTWDRTLEALEVQQWLLGLHTGEEQVGRATLAYVLAHQKRQEVQAHETHYAESWQEHSFFVLAPSNPVRRVITAIVESLWFEIFILCVIFAASICFAVYAPGDTNRDMGGSYNSGKYKALHVLDDIFTVIFTVEMVLKWISMGVVLPVGKAYCWHLWNLFDLFIVVISLVSWGDHHIFLRYLKVMRCFRVLGPLRYIRWNRSMSNVARAIWDGIPTLANVCLIMLLNYIVWAIIFTSMFMNRMSTCTNATITNQKECLEHRAQWLPPPRNFQNFYQSLLTTFEISTGAEWMDVIYSAVDSRTPGLSAKTNRHPYLGLVFIAYYYLSHFVLFTLFVSAVIYCYLLAKSAADGALGASPEQQLWIRIQEMLRRLRPASRLVPLSNPISRMLHKLTTNRWFEAFMALILVFNMVTMSLQWHGMNHTQDITLKVFQWVFVGLFTVEVLLRLAAVGPRLFTRWSYCWDVFVVCLSYIQIGLNTTDSHHVPFNVNVLRMLRVGRVLHLVHLLTPFHTYFALFDEVIRNSIPAIISVSMIYMLAVYVFAILGLHFLGYIAPYGGYIDGKYNNFQTFVNALIMVFRLSTLENWVDMLRGSLDRGYYCGRESQRCGPTDWAPVYYVPLALCFFMITTLFMAVLFDNFMTVVRTRSDVELLGDLQRFSVLWRQRDPNGTLLLPISALAEVLEAMRLPLGLQNRHNRVELLRLLRAYDIPTRNGRVYYYDVLVPLARRVMAMALHKQKNGSSDHHKLSWQVAERSLRALPTHVVDENGPASGPTAAEHYAASYMQAAYRRDRAMRDYYLIRSERWRQGRRYCEEHHLPYDSYGFGGVGLSYEDPREEGIRRGFDLPEGAKPGVAGPVYANRSTALRAAQDMAAQKSFKEASTLLPAVYRTAIDVPERRFGPDAPGAVRRDERRSDKLRRKRAEEATQRARHEQEESAFEREEAARALDNLVNGRDGSAQRSPSPRQRPKASRTPGSRGAAVSASAGGAVHTRPAPVVYNADPSDVNYQPPLGTAPEVMRQEEIQRRRAMEGAGSEELTEEGSSLSASPSQEQEEL